MSDQPYSEQPLEPEIFKIVDEHFVKPWLANTLRLKLEACGLHYTNVRNLETTNDFAEYVGCLIADYVRSKDHVRKYAHQYDAFPERVTYPSAEADRLARVKTDYTSWSELLHRTADNLLDAIQFAKVHQLIEDGCEKKLQEATAHIRELKKELAECEQRNKVHPLDDDRTQTGDVGEASPSPPPQ